LSSDRSNNTCRSHALGGRIGGLTAHSRRDSGEEATGAVPERERRAEFIRKLYFDEDALDPRVHRALADGGVAIYTVVTENLRGRSDAEQLRHATSLGCILYTFNVGDYLRLHSVSFGTSFSHTGIIVCTRQLLPIGDQLRGIQAFAAQYPSDDDWVNRMEFLKAAR
jgi:hypothetical protein